MDLTPFLGALNNPDDATRNAAEMQLKQAEESNYEMFLMGLCVELATEAKDSANRRQAGLYLKNLFTAQDNAIKQAKLAKWGACQPHTKEQFRLGLLQAMASQDLHAAHTAAQATAALASIEVPTNEWPTLLPTLLNNVQDDKVPAITKVASLDALGYMCEEMDPDDCDKSIVDQILHTVISGMAEVQPNEMKKAAIGALINSLDFTEPHFNVDSQRDYIMQAVCSLAQCTDVDVREMVYQCLSDIAESYYEFMKNYMVALFPLTTQAISTDDPRVGMMALQFWSSIFDVESETEDEANLGIGALAMPHLIPFILDSLLKQNEHDDDDDMTIHRYAGICLQSLTQDVKDTIIDPVIAFVQPHIQSPQWQAKDAALFALGTLLMGSCNQEKLTQYVGHSIPLLIEGLQDGSPKIRNTSAWAIGHVLENHLILVPPEQLQILVAGLMHLIDDPDTTVKKRAITSIDQFAAAFDDESDGVPTNLLSSFVEQLVLKLLLTANTQDCEVTMETYEAASRLIERSAEDKYPFILNVLIEANARLEGTFTGGGDAEQVVNNQTLICGLINCCAMKLPQDMILTQADQIIQNMLRVFQTEATGAVEEAYQTVGHVAEKTGDAFERYFQHIIPFIIKGLKQTDQKDACMHSISCTQAIATALNKKLPKYTGADGTLGLDAIVTELLTILKSDSAHRNLKPVAISCFSDLALAVEGDFEKYSKVVLDILEGARSQQADPEDRELVDYIDDLRLSILDAYTGVTNGLKAGGKLGAMMPYVEGIFQFVGMLPNTLQNSYNAVELMEKAIGLIFDITVAFGKSIEPFLPAAEQLLVQGDQLGTKEEDEKLLAIVQLARNIFTELRQSNNRVG